MLDRRLSDKRVFPSIDMFRSGTRKEELLLSDAVLSKIWVLRRFLSDKPIVEDMEFLLEKMAKTKTNKKFLEAMNA